MGSGVPTFGFGVVHVVEGGRCGVGVGEVCLVFLFCGSGLVPVVGRDRMTGWGAVVGFCWGGGGRGLFAGKITIKGQA